MPPAPTPGYAGTSVLDDGKGRETGLVASCLLGFVYSKPLGIHCSEKGQRCRGASESSAVLRTAHAEVSDSLGPAWPHGRRGQLGDGMYSARVDGAEETFGLVRSKQVWG